MLKLRPAPFSERKNYMHPSMVRHRRGFASLADVTGMNDGTGYDASSCSDRLPPTGKPIEILEAGIWRLADGLVIEAWFFGDELRLLRQLGVIHDAQLRAAAER